MITVKEETTPSKRALVQVIRAALRHGLNVEAHVKECMYGKVYCSSCHEYKLKEEFPKSNYTLSYIRVCYQCKGSTPEPPNWRGDNPHLVGKSFGTCVAAAKRIDIPISEYLLHIRNNERWCSRHHGWYDATELLKTRNDQSIRICNPCAAEKTREYRERTRRANK